MTSGSASLAAGDDVRIALSDPTGVRICLSDPTGQIERECADKVFRQKDVALTYALAIRDESIVPVDWPRANAAIVKRWPHGLARVKELAWKRFSK